MTKMPTLMTQRDNTGSASILPANMAAKRGTTAVKMKSTAPTPASTSTIGYVSAFLSSWLRRSSVSIWDAASFSADPSAPVSAPASTSWKT